MSTSDYDTLYLRENKTSRAFLPILKSKEAKRVISVPSKDEILAAAENDNKINIVFKSGRMEVSLHTHLNEIVVPHNKNAIIFVTLDGRVIDWNYSNRTGTLR